MNDTDPIAQIRAALDAGPTPGPWHRSALRLQGYDPKMDGCDIGAEDCSNVALAWHDRDDRTEAETIANASLIAACHPENLRALLDRLAAREAECERLRSELNDCLNVLPGSAYYMDPPDGGSVTIAEQLRRMGEDAARYRHLRACVYIDPQQLILRIANVYLCRDDGPDVAAQLDAAIDAARSKE